MRELESGNTEYTAMVGGTFLEEQFASTFSWETRMRPDGTGHDEIRGFFNVQDGTAGKYAGNGNG